VLIAQEVSAIAVGPEMTMRDDERRWAGHRSGADVV